MPSPRSRPNYRRVGLYLLIVMAATLVGMTAYVMLAGEGPVDTADVFPEPVLPDPELRPNFVFPEALRTYDLSLNRFIDRFARVCMQARYSEFRLMHTRRVDPIPPRRFESIFNAVRNIRIQALRKIEDAAAGEDHAAYLMEAELDLAPHAVRRNEESRRVVVAIRKEGGEWRIGPPTAEMVAGLEQSDSGPSTRPTRVNLLSAPHGAPTSIRVPTAAANRPPAPSP